MAGEAIVRGASRSAFGLTIYRLVVNFAFLVAGFNAFPQHILVFALALIVFNCGIAALGQVLAINVAVDNRLNDMAERKTRHAIILAQERGLQGESCNDYSFWNDVDTRVQAELGDADAPLKCWQSAGLTVSSTLGWLIQDLISVFFALIISGKK